MSYTFFDFITLVGALGLFLYGMKLMSEGLQKIAGDNLRSTLAAMTKTPWMGVLTGTLITVLIQSSSATTVMVVSFVNAGLLELTQAISLIMGANVGTTITAWIISLFGFKFTFADITLPIIAISIPFIFSSANKRKSIGECLLGFALLFYGLELIKVNVPDLKSNPEMLAFLTQYVDYGFGSVMLFVLIGAVLTVVVQSSSATMAITLVLCCKGWVPFELAAAMVLGENLGTTVTANLAAIPANVSAKRAAMAHLVFNVIGAVWTLALFYPLITFISYLMAVIDNGDPTQLQSFMASLDVQTLERIEDPSAVLTPQQLAIKNQLISMQLSTSFGLALFHTVFNVANTLLLMFFVKQIARLVTIMIPQKSHDEEFRLAYISSGLLSTSELSILQADKEIDIYAERSVKMFGIVRELYDEKNEELFDKAFVRIAKYEGICDRMEIEIANYLTKVAEGRLSGRSKQDVHAMLRVVSEIESIGDGCYNISRIIKRKREDGIEYSDEMRNHVYQMFDLVQSALDEMLRILYRADYDHRRYSMKVINDVEAQINELRTNLKMQNATDVKAQKYPYPVSVTYMDLINECEKVGDYVVNVVEQYKETVHSTSH